MSAPLAEVIRGEIERAGPIPFRRFMELALYHPELGYYTSGRARIGRRGDFFTNVSVGPLFGKLLARQFAEMWEALDEPDAFTLVEQGGNDGQLAADVLEALREHSPDCYDATSYCIIEPAPRLIDRQRERLSAMPVTWLESISALRTFTGVHFSNELIDAFPVHLVEWNGAKWRERYVAREGRGFVFSSGPLSDAKLAAACASIPQLLPPGYVTEINLAAGEWIREVATRLKRGYVLAIDYGHLREDYYTPERISGTLSAYAQHRREPDPLAHPGDIDLTAHVEFTSLIEAATAAGLDLVGFTDQHHFMVGIGTSYFEEGASPSDLRAFQTLMHPSLMGQAFKVVVFGKGGAPGELKGMQFARPLG